MPDAPFSVFRVASLAFGVGSAAIAFAGCDETPEPAAPATQEASEQAPEGPPETPEAHAGIDIDDPNTCAGCHGAIVEEWRTSQHSRAHHSADPIYGAMRTLRMERQGEHLAQRCASCHGPRAIDDVDGEVAHQGVSCATCHNLEGVELAAGRGSKALRYAEGNVLRGPHNVASDSAAPHGVGAAAPWLTDGQTLCLSCHGAMANPAGAPTCTTGPEFGQRSDASETCVGCHMPEVATPSGIVSSRSSHRSHGFLGPHGLWDGSDAGLMASALEGQGALEGNTATLRLRNLTGHALPTGFPGRMMIVRAIAFDAQGQERWRNFRENPMREDPQGVFNKVYVDGEGAPVMPPFAETLRRDSRLTPGEERTLRWELPEGVHRVEWTMLFRLLPPPAAAALGLGEHAQASPRPFARFEVVRSAASGD